MDISPIGYFHTDSIYPYDVPRQGVCADDATGTIELLPGNNFEQALEGLEGFSHIWVIFQFHENHHWHPKVMPPRHTTKKVGVFASRSPYRPNGIGISAVQLVSVQGRKLFIANHDLLDGTPILDIKPYLTYADSFPEATCGWTEMDASEQPVCEVVLSSHAETQLLWLEQHGVTRLRSFIMTHLSYEPTNKERHRLVTLENQTVALAYRTWRVVFTLREQCVTVSEIRSGYSQEELNDMTHDPYGDKLIHRGFSEIPLA